MPQTTEAGHLKKDYWRSIVMFSFTAPKTARTVGAALIALSCLYPSAGFAQEPSASHLEAAKKALTATKATETFDNILLEASARLANQLTANNPDQADNISTIVNEEAIALAPRRGDLETEAAKLFAANFTEEELDSISTFFSSGPGEKYLEKTPILARELGKTARVWATGIQRDLGENVTKKLQPKGN